jgi:hypothetical protein
MTTNDKTHSETCICDNEYHETLTWWIDVISDQLARRPNEYDTDLNLPGWRRLSVITSVLDLDTLRYLLIEKRASLPSWDGS